MTTLSKLAELQKLRDLKEAVDKLWDCGLPGCDGKPGHVIPGTRVTINVPHARASQLQPPGDWRTWAVLAGRGFGKTRLAAEWTKARALRIPNSVTGIIAPDFATAKNICMEGEAGLLECLPAKRIRSYNKSTAELTLVNGSKFFTFSTNSQNDAEKVRGFNFHTLHFEELATQRYGEIAWDIANPALRAGTDPRMIVTTTPRNVPMIRRLMKTEPFVVLTRGRTMDNADNLAATTISYLEQRYKDTRLGRQELEGELLEDQPGALWSFELIENGRINARSSAEDEFRREDLDRVIVGVDPAGSNRTTSDETGIVVVGKRGEHFFVLADYSGRYSPEEWRTKVLEAYQLHQADAVVAESNFGGAMVQQVLRDADRSIRYREAHATRGKALRAEPIVMLYEQGRVHHLGVLADLESQMTSWVPPGQFETDEKTGAQVPLDASSWSPDRVDALVWACTDLMTTQKRQIKSWS